MVTSLDAAELLPRNARQPPCLVLRFIPHISVKPCTCLLALILSCLFCLVPTIGVWAVDYWAPWVTKLSTNSAIINWQGASDASGSIEYATSSYYNAHHSFDKTISSPTKSQYQHVQLTGLEPNTSYIYRVRPSDNKDVFSNRTFRTMPVSGPFTFIVISDSHAQEKRFKYVADAIAKYETDVLFILDGGDYAGWDLRGILDHLFPVCRWDACEISHLSHYREP
ncbi:MAG: hypothetical protein C0392_09835 [Syntrophus sp. (in: bacteria)]|nr:hypothetical protein [Syntrophus sp. (in: bacteria)]